MLASAQPRESSKPDFLFIMKMCLTENRTLEYAVPAQDNLSLRNLKIWNGVDDQIDSGLDAITIENGRFAFVGSSEELESESRDMGGSHSFLD